MKFRIQLKDPDGFCDGFDDAVRESVSNIDGLDDDERSEVLDKRGETLRKFSGRWVQYNEYITIEFDTDANTAKVVELGN